MTYIFQTNKKHIPLKVKRSFG